jgi:hypothetical protein
MYSALPVAKEKFRIVSVQQIQSSPYPPIAMISPV